MPHNPYAYPLQKIYQSRYAYYLQVAYCLECPLLIHQQIHHHPYYTQFKNGSHDAIGPVLRLCGVVSLRTAQYVAYNQRQVGS